MKTNNAVQKSKYKYNRRSGCWNCGLHGHVFKNCRRHRVIRCSFCLKIGTKSQDCDCRKIALQGIPTKTIQEPLRVMNGRLVLDIKITADIFTATIDTTCSISKAHQAIVNYLMLGGMKKNADNTIFVDVNVCSRRSCVKFEITNNIDLPITIGLEAFFEMGYNFQESNQPEIPVPNRLLVSINNEYFEPPTDDQNVSNSSPIHEALDDILDINWNESL